MDSNSEMEKAVSFLHQETPKIADAVKNLIALLLALSKTASTTDLESGSRTYFSDLEALECGKLLLKAIQKCGDELDRDLIGWGVNNPQLPDQSAIDRLDQIVQYKAVLFLTNRISNLSKPITVNKCFGRTFLIWSGIDLNHIRDVAMTLREDKVSDLLLSKFIDEFQQSLTKLVVSEDKDVWDVIWSANFRVALANLSKRRLESVVKNQVQMEESENI